MTVSFLAVPIGYLPERRLLTRVVVSLPGYLICALSQTCKITARG